MTVARKYTLSVLALIILNCAFAQSLQDEAKARVKKDTFNVSVVPKGDIAGSHFYLEGVSGPLVLFSGGYNASQEDYVKLATNLASAGYHVITFDLRGHGKSSAPLTNEETLRGTRHDPPIHDQATHDGLEIYHSKDLEAVYQYVMSLPEVEGEGAIIGLSSTSIMYWSSDMIQSHPELTRFILLTASGFSLELGTYFSNSSGFDILTVMSAGEGHFNEKGVKAGIKKTEDYFAQNKNHRVQLVYCKSGYGNSVLEECPKAGQEVIKWIEKLSGN